MRKRGQAAAFIIIGLIVLIIIIGFIAVKKGIIKSLYEKITTERQAVPQQIRPLQDFLDSCVTQTTKEGIQLLAQQGGYIALQSDSIPTTPFTPLGSSLEIFQNSDFRTSVWFRERGNGIQESNIPTKKLMEDQLSSHIMVNFPKCLNNLTAFSDQYEINIEGEIKAETTISNNKVSARVKLPVNVKILDTEFTLSEHGSDVESNLGKLYTMAKEIAEKENKDLFLEQKTIDMLVAYNDEVPFSGTDFSCTEKVWFKNQIEMKLKNIIFENVGVIHVKGTNYKLNNEKLEYLEFDALKTKDNDVNVNLMYIPEWPTLIEIQPSEGNILRSDSISKKTGSSAATVISSLFCLNTYRFVYDIKYPVLITLTDKDGLMFQFATEVIVDNNQPRENKLETLDLPDISSPICQYPQREVTIFSAAIDENENLVPLDDVSLSFKCFPASCPLGNSKLNQDGEPVLTTFVPLCFNGVVEAAKEGYKQVQKTFFSSNDENIPPEVVVMLEPVYKKKVNMFVIDKETGEVREPYSTEQINFQFIHTQTNHQPAFIYPSEENIIELVPGDYIVNSYLLRNSSTYKITLPKEKIENCIDSRDLGLFGFFKTKKVCQTIETEPMEFETVLTGGAANVESTFTRQELASSSPLNLYVLSSQIPGSQEDLQRIQIEVETNKDHPLFRYPEIS